MRVFCDIHVQHGGWGFTRVAPLKYLAAQVLKKDESKHTKYVRYVISALYTFFPTFLLHDHGQSRGRRRRYDWQAVADTANGALLTRRAVLAINGCIFMLSAKPLSSIHQWALRRQTRTGILRFPEVWKRDSSCRELGFSVNLFVSHTSLCPISRGHAINQVVAPIYSPHVMFDRQIIHLHAATLWTIMTLFVQTMYLNSTSGCEYGEDGLAHLHSLNLVTQSQLPALINKQ
jgi:hypothetical protein